MTPAADPPIGSGRGWPLLAHSDAVGHLPIVIVAIFLILAYAAANHRRLQAGRITGPQHRLFFGLWTAGVVAASGATVPVLEVWAQGSFTGHMVQHLLLISVAAPLLVLARPLQCLQQAGWVSPPRGRRAHDVRTAARWWRANAAPTGAGFFVVTLWVTHLSGVYDLALTNRLVHEGTHVAYLGSAVALWSAVRTKGVARGPARIGAVFAVIGASALLGVILITSPEPLVATYAEHLGTVGAVTDQRRAASLMWVAGMLTTLPLLISSVWSWASAEQRIAERSEALERPSLR